MRKILLVAATVLSLATLSVLAVSGTTQADVAVSLPVGDTFMNVSGKTSPRAFVTIKDDDNVIGTLTAEADGTFSKTLVAQRPGIHTLSIYARDTDDEISDSAVVTVSLAEHGQTNISVFLPPTIVVSSLVTKPDAQLSLSGMTVPGSTVFLRIDDMTSMQAQADAAGRWQIIINPGQVKGGNHSVYAFAADSDGTQGYPSGPRFFMILAAEASSPVGDPTRSVYPAPRITVPTDRSVVRSPVIGVAGLSEPGAQIEIWRNHHPVGAVFADTIGGWLMNVALENGANELQSRACNSKGCSEFSKSVIVTYAADKAVRVRMQASLNNYRFERPVGKALTVAVRTINGTAPLTYTFNWGDGEHQSVISNDLTSAASHAYTKSGNYTGHVRIIDAAGQLVDIPFTVVVTKPSAFGSTVVQSGIIGINAVLLYALCWTIANHSPLAPLLVGKKHKKKVPKRRKA